MKRPNIKVCACGEFFEQDQCPCCADRESVSLDAYISEIADLCKNKLKAHNCELEKQRIEAKLEVDNLISYVEAPERFYLLEEGAHLTKIHLRKISFMLRELNKP